MKKTQAELMAEGKKCVKMMFPQDMFFNDFTVPIYDAGKVYDVPEEMSVRWIMHGGWIVEDAVEQSPVEEKIEAKEEEQVQQPVVEPPPVETKKSSKGRHNR